MKKRKKKTLRPCFPRPCSGQAGQASSPRVAQNERPEFAETQKHKVRTVAGRHVKMDPEVFYHPRILNGTMFIHEGRVIVRNRKTLKQFSLSRYILKARKGQVVDHENRNPLDNRRCNLRIATVRQNNLNRILRNSTGYIGVSINRHKSPKGITYACYCGNHRVKGKEHCLYTSLGNKGLVFAAIARDKFVIQAGDDEFAPLNFPCFKYEPFRSLLLRSDLNEFK